MRNFAMSVQNLELQFIEHDAFNALTLEIFLTISSSFLLVWVLVFQNRKDLGYSNMASSTKWTAVLILILSLYITQFSNCTSFLSLPLGGALSLDNFSFLGRLLILSSCLAFFIISAPFLKENPGGVNEFCNLVLLSVISLVLLVSVNDFLSLFMCIELQSLSFYVLACFKRNSDFSIEASVKYFITGAIASCLMLFGISLIYGITGTLNFLELKQLCSLADSAGLSISRTFTYVGLNLGIFFLLAALLFKLGAAPLHFWLPDVYEGSTTNVTSFFALVPKVALLILIIRIFLDTFGSLIYLWQPILLSVSLLSTCIGTIGAFYQRRIKRLLAYSTIGHTGFILLGCATNSQEGLNALFLYLIIYILTSISIFVFLLNVQERGVSISNPTLFEACGIVQTNRLLGLCLTLPLLSLAGIPPLIGFIAKFQIFIASVQAGYLLMSLVFVLVSVVACYYYLRLTKIYFFENSPFIIWSGTISREASLSFSFSCGLIMLLTILPKFLNVWSL